MRAVTFEAFDVGQRVRFSSNNPQHEPIGTITEVDHVSEHIVVAWDDGHRPSNLAALEAMRKLEIV